jgi:DNA-binding beta-propeller fold protein YncE
MNTFFPGSGRLTIFFFSIILPASVACADPTYHLLKEIAVGGEGGWDYLADDDAAHRLYVSHSTKIVVIDTQADAVAGEIDDTPGVHGFAIAPDLQRGFSSNGQEAKAGIIDLKTLKTIAKVNTGKNPDAIIYASGQREVYTFNGRDQSATVFDAMTGNVMATIALPGKPEFAAYDPATSLVYDNIEDKSEVVVIDAKTHRIVNTWPIAPGAEASGLAIDLEHHRLFIGCHNRLMLMMDGANGRVLASVPIGEGVDANAFDPGAQLAFSSNSDGTLTVAREDAPDKLAVVQNVTTEKGARTMALDLKTGKVYLATAQFAVPPQSQPAPGRPAPLPGTFKILVYGK